MNLSDCSTAARTRLGSLYIHLYLQNYKGRNYYYPTLLTDFILTKVWYSQNLKRNPSDSSRKWETKLRAPENKAKTFYACTFFACSALQKKQIMDFRNRSKKISAKVNVVFTLVQSPCFRVTLSVKLSWRQVHAVYLYITYPGRTVHLQCDGNHCYIWPRIGMNQ